VTARRVVVAALVIAGGFAVGRLTADGSPSRTTTERIVERGPQRTIVERAVTPDLDEIRRVVREELAHGAAPSSTLESAADEPEHPDRDILLSQARTALETGMADGRWNDDDRARLRDALGSLSPHEAGELFDTLLLALNSGTLQADVHGAPI
jgi:hypothetical protein